ncbi:MAG: THUMP domain-containing protein [Candidatus Verstraetearchaeota archaeon]|nr:THUMP domain-containing protein [Candidatus Verstraetearchaeota archaeon]
MSMHYVLVTCPAGKERRAFIEVLDCILPYDSSAHVEISNTFRGVLLLKTALNSMEAARILFECPTSVICRVVPLVKFVPSKVEDVVEAAKELLANSPKFSSFAVKCIRRGRAFSSSAALSSLLGKVIAEAFNMKVDLTNPEVFLWIEVLGGHTGLSLLTPGQIYRKRCR